MRRMFWAAMAVGGLTIGALMIGTLTTGAVAAGATAGVAPQLTLDDLAGLPILERTPYDEKADAAKAVDAALVRAKKSHKRVLIDLGGNWCPDCLILANLMRLPEMKAYLAKHFEIVTVDVGRFDKNLDIPARYGITKRLDGVPAVIVVDPVGGPFGTIVNRNDYYALSDARHMRAQGISDWLAKWAKR